MKTAFLDANIILRYLTGDDPKKMKACAKLFREALNGKVCLISSETIMAEVVYVLGSKRNYGLSAAEISNRLKPILSIRGLKLEHKDALLYALNLFTRLEIDFEDCLALAHMERQQLKEIYSYDQDFDQVTSVNRLEP